MLVWVYFFLATLLYAGTYKVGPGPTIALSLASIGFLLASVVKSFPNGNTPRASNQPLPPSTKSSCSACARKNLKV